MNICNYLVRDYMHREPKTIRESASLDQALVAMTAGKTNSLIVLDEDGDISGTLSTWDIIAELVPSYLDMDDNLANFASGDLFCARTERLKDCVVKRVMTRDVYTIQEDETLIAAASLLVKHRIRQIPVVDAEDQLIGYINRTDMKIAMAHGLGIEA